MQNAMEVANYIIDYSNNNKISITNLKLQKLLYYVQAASLVELKEKCFNDPIMAWQYGPVVESVYFRFNEYGGDEIPKQNIEMLFFDNESMTMKFKGIGDINSKFIVILNKVIDAYKDIQSPFVLVRKTHSEDPWKNTEINNEILIRSIEEYYTKYPEKIYR